MVGFRTPAGEWVRVVSGNSVFEAASKALEFFASDDWYGPQPRLCFTPCADEKPRCRKGVKKESFSTVMSTARIGSQEISLGAPLTAFAAMAGWLDAFTR